MTERVVRTTLQAVVTNYVAGMEKASKATALTATEAQRLASQGQAFTSLGTSAMKMGLVVGVGLAVAIARFAEFDQAMSQVKAATQETAENMDLLREAAIRAGAETQYSATEAANAIEELGKAGLTTAQIIDGGLDGALTLAAAGGIGVAEAAGYAAIAMKQFGLEGSQLPHVADLFAAGAGKAVGDVSDLAQALGQAGLVANGAGQSIEDTTGVLAAFADAGLLGSDAGTSLKSAIIALQAPTDKAASLMEQYNLSFYDANGAMLSYQEIAGQLTTNLSDLTEEERNATLAKIFGNDALRAANVLYKEGQVGIQGYIDQTNDSGYAAKVAADRMDNLSGDIEKLGGSFDTALIRTGSGANDVLRSIVQSAGFLVDVVGGMPEPVLNAGLAFGVVTAALALTGGTALVTVPKFTALQATIAASGINMKSFALRTVAAGGALGIATIAIGYFVGKAADAAANTAEFKDSLDQTTGALTDYTRKLVINKLTEADAFSQAAEFGISQKELTDAVLKGGDAYEKITDKIKGYNNITHLWGTNNAWIAGTVTESLKGARDELDGAVEDFEDQAAAADESAESTETAAAAYTNAADQAQGLTDNLTDLIATINESNGVGQDVVSTNAAYQQSLADIVDYVKQAREGVEGFSLGWDANTAAGSANREMLSGLAQDSQKAAEAQLALDGNTDAYLATVTAGNQLMYDQAIAFGASSEEAQLFADTVYRIPTEHETKIIADTAQASWTIDDFISRMGRKVGVINFRATLSDLNGSESGNGRGGGFAKGGYTPKTATITQVGEEGEEFVSTNRTLSDPANRAALEFMHAGGSMADYGIYSAPQYASSAPASSGASVNVSPQVSLAGATLVMTMDGRQFTAVIQDQIVANDSANAQTSSSGRRVR
jgi:TP901 family phage tail tape measure protein